MGATYTKGEWNVDSCAVNGIVITNSNESQAIAFIPVKSENAEANSKLIQSAPDLLEALQSLVASTYNGCSRKESQEQLEKAESAITKALGGTNS